MYVLRRRTRIEIWTPAKLNLYLEVLGRRVDGYHEVETLMVPVNLYDTLRFWATDDEQLALTCRWARDGSGALVAGELPPVEQNLVYRAVALLRARSGVQRGLRVLLIKRIPPASGLGGGSSDAAAALVGANLAWGLDWPTPRLAELGAELGSDVPFFLARGAAVCRGRGERIESVRGGPPRHYVIVRPPRGLSTATVYGQLQASLADGRVDGILGWLQAGRTDRPAGLLLNRLQSVARRLSGDVAALERQFGCVDVVGHQLSGSGSGYFGICRNAKHSLRVAAMLRARAAGQVFRAVSLAADHPPARRMGQD